MTRIAAITFICLLGHCSYAAAGMGLDERLLLASRMMERVVGVTAAIALIVVGYRLLRSSRTRARPTERAEFRLASLGEITLSGYGPGLVCVSLGALLIALSLYNTIELQPGGNIRFFDRDTLTSRDLQVERAFLAGARLLNLECASPTATPRLQAACEPIKGYRELVIEKKYDRQLNRLRELDARRNANPSDLTPAEFEEYVLLKEALS